MEGQPAQPDAATDDGALADFRRTVERLRSETISELGRQPMPPEKLAVIALALASVSMLLLARESAPAAWQVIPTLLVVWGASFQIQRVRYERFHAAWSHKVAVRAAVLARPAQIPGFFRRHP